jgi:Ni/Co efflux regulator RcnB
MMMRVYLFVCAAMASVMVPAAAFADDPHDPAMRSAAARARDREIIRQLNLKEAAHVRERDARYAQGWRAARRSTYANQEYADSTRDHERALADYDRDRAAYQRDMIEWRRAVAACRARDYSACDR